MSVISLTTSTVTTQQDAIEKLEYALAQAKDGRIACVGIAIVTSDGGIDTIWSRCHLAGSLIGAIALLQHRLIEG